MIMKKSIILGMLAAALLSMGLTSCGDDEYTDSKVTYFVDLALKGESTVSTPLNSNYVDAGFTATINGQDASDHVVTTSNVNTAELGPYSVVYTATNDDGYSSTVTRKVYVGDYTPGTVASGSHRTNSKGAVTAYSGYEIPVTTDGNGNYWIEDLLGGYYEQKAGYGSDYAMPGFIKVNSDNSISITKGGVIPGWESDGPYDSIKGHYDPAAKTLTWDLTWQGMVFHVILQF